MKHSKSSGKLIMLEGCVEGVNELNDLRSAIGLKPIPVRWYNLFILEKNY